MINFHVQGSVLTNNMVPPRVLINGHHVQVPTSGTTSVPAPPGHHHIDVSLQWLRTFGQAQLDVQLAPGQSVDVFYAPPHHQWATGALGFEPQQRKGLGGMIGIIVAVVVVVLLLALLPSFL